jgi:hypothetical protein
MLGYAVVLRFAGHYSTNRIAHTKIRAKICTADLPCL